MEMEVKQRKLRVLMFPWLAHGHLFPHFELGKRLSTRNFKVYICSSAINLDSIKNMPECRDEDDVDSIELVQLHIPSSAELPTHLHTTKNLPTHLIPALIGTLQLSKTSFSEILTSLEPNLLIFDVFQPWAAKAASAFGIPSIYLGTSGATPLSYFHHLYTHGTSSPFPYQAIYLQGHEQIDPRRTQLPVDDMGEGFAFGTFNLSTELVLIKSLTEIEDKYIDYLSVLSNKRIIPTGPLLSNTDDHEDEKLSETMKWLDQKQHSSTVYVSFGSECFLSKEEMQEVAKGLELCQANFVWVIRFSAQDKETPLELEETLPQGFLQRTQDKGMIVTGWAPQTKILEHPSVGGFISHCGWSSITESLYFGVPVIAMPMRVEQPLNARMLVEAGVGLEVERKGKEKYTREAIAKAIDQVIVEEPNLRNRAKALSNKIKEKEEEEMNVVAEELRKICIH